MSKEAPRAEVIKALALLVKSTDFLRKFAPLLDINNVTQPEVRFLFKTLPTFMEQYGVTPGFPALYDALEAQETDAEKKEIIYAFIEEMERVAPQESKEPIYGDYLEDFLRRNYIRTALGEVRSHLEDGDTDAAEQRMLDLRVPKIRNTETFIVPDDAAYLFAKITEEELKSLVSTGIVELDAKLDGGVFPEELCVCLAPLGYGKSQWLVHVGAAAWRNGKNVYHFSFENSAKETMGRYFANMTGTPIKEIVEDSNHRALERLQLDGTGPCIAVQRLIGSATTINTLTNAIHDINDDYDMKPGLIVVDYGDLMRPINKGKNKYEDAQNVFAELRDLATLFKVPVWTATQSNREGLKATRVGLHQISESLGKAMAADLIIGLSRPNKQSKKDETDFHDDEEVSAVVDKLGEVAELKILKFRRGDDNIKAVKVKTRFDIASFEEYDEYRDELDDVELSRDDNAQDTLRSVREQKRNQST